jgi:hypothetical protein
MLDLDKKPIERNRRLITIATRILNKGKGAVIDIDNISVDSDELLTTQEDF